MTLMTSALNSVDEEGTNTAGNELFVAKAKTVMRMTSALKVFAATYTAASTSTAAFAAALSSSSSASSEVTRHTN